MLQVEIKIQAVGKHTQESETLDDQPSRGIIIKQVTEIRACNAYCQGAKSPYCLQRGHIFWAQFATTNHQNLTMVHNVQLMWTLILINV